MPMLRIMIVPTTAESMSVPSVNRSKEGHHLHSQNNLDTKRGFAETLVSLSNSGLSATRGTVCPIWNRASWRRPAAGLRLW
jgi:hypothetical protein